MAQGNLKNKPDLLQKCTVENGEQRKIYFAKVSPFFCSLFTFAHHVISSDNNAATIV
jgi:hypothetical protein